MLNLNLTALQSQEFIVGIAVAAIVVSALVASSLFRNIALALAAGAVVLLYLQGGVGALVATAILALALAVDAWLAALIVTVVLFAAAGLAALLGKKQVDQGMPPAPQQTVESVKEDLHTVQQGMKEGRS